MKALIAAGGHGTRLRPITWTINKHLIPIANKPMIFYPLEKVAEVGIREVGIIINPGDQELPKAVGNGDKWGIKITYIEQTGGPLGLAHVVRMAEPFIGKEPFVFYLGDNIILGSIKKFVEKFEKSKVNCLLSLSKVKDPQRFGVPVIEGDKIIRVEEKPSDPQSDFAVTGIYIYDHHIFEAAKNIKPSARGELEISDAHTYLIEHGYEVGYEEITGWWKDTGTAEALLEGNQLILGDIAPEIMGDVHPGAIIQGKVIIGRGTEIGEKTMIRGPVVIGENCVVKNSYVGPFTAVGDRSEIYNTEIEHSIVFGDADIDCESRITDSLIGLNATVTSARRSFPSGHKLIIGDNSAVEL